MQKKCKYENQGIDYMALENQILTDLSKDTFVKPNQIEGIIFQTEYKLSKKPTIHSLFLTSNQNSKTLEYLATQLNLDLHLLCKLQEDIYQSPRKWVDDVTEGLNLFSKRNYIKIDKFEKRYAFLISEVTEGIY